MIRRFALANNNCALTPRRLTPTARPRSLAGDYGLSSSINQAGEALAIFAQSSART
jgi:hypothetical protein